MIQIIEDDRPPTHHLRVKDIDELTELFVDDDKKLPKVTPKCNAFHEEIFEWFGNELFSYQEAKEFGEAHGHSMYAVTQWLNMLWKFGKLRKFCINEWIGHKAGTTSGGKYWGVHYKLL